MPRPVADQVPPCIRDEIAVLGLSGLSEYAEIKGLKPCTLRSLFTNNHEPIKPYLGIVRLVNTTIKPGFTIDDLVEVIEGGKAAELTERLKSATRCTTWSGLAGLIGASENFPKRFAQNQKELKALKPYVNASRKIGHPLDRLVVQMGLQ